MSELRGPADRPTPPPSVPGARTTFVARHLGPDASEVSAMLGRLGYDSLEDLVEAAIPASIRWRGEFSLGEGCSEATALEEIEALAADNRLHRSFLGMGYSGCILPPVIQRNVLENPAWYTAYTPYQSEISQGRLEALLSFQTVVCDLTGLEIANASLLDEGTAAAEAMALSHAAVGGRSRFMVDEACHPQTLEVVETRARALGIEVVVGDVWSADVDDACFGVLVQVPDTHGRVRDPRPVIEAAHGCGALVTVATDLLALVEIESPGAMGADLAVGSAQRFGVPMGFGGPHAAFFACRDAFKRRIPGRMVGVSRDAEGRQAYRLALQTREQHIRRERATSNICTAQVLLAVIAGLYAVWHGPEGLRVIARRVRAHGRRLAEGLARLGHGLGDHPFFDTLHVRPVGLEASTVAERSQQRRFNLRDYGDGSWGIALDETTTEDHVDALLEIFDVSDRQSVAPPPDLADDQLRSDSFLEHPVFHSYRSETQMLRYLHGLAAKDLSLTTSMIPLGSCTMKLNATAEMMPVTWPSFAHLHPFAPREQSAGYRRLFSDLEGWLSELTGFAATSLQPNAGSQGEYAGLLVIRRYLESQGETDRRVCLIPQSAHGTNPASAAMAGLDVVVVACDDAGNIEMADLRAKAEQHAERLAALMVTYPSTHGVFEATIQEICDIVHGCGGQVYMDGANFNAMVGLCRPGDFGADVCHLNLHKTFCIPHGGGGPGVGPICVAEHLKPHLPGHRLTGLGGEQAVGAISAAPWGSASILPISWMYIRMMGAEGLSQASRIAILNANYIAARLVDSFPVLYTGASGLVAHECILDLRLLKRSCGVEVEDVAKRLMDYGFHAPTVSWPVAGTLMVEPTESESMDELDRFCDALIAIRAEAGEIEAGAVPLEDSPLRRAPHPAECVVDDAWDRPYSRTQAAFPLPVVRQRKYWPPVARIDNVYGDRNLVCSCPPVEDYVED